MFGLQEDEWRDLVLSVNTHRKNRRLSPFRAAALIDAAASASGEEPVAEGLGFTDLTTFRQIRKLAQLDPGLGSVVDWGSRRGSLSMSTATMLMRLQSRSEIEEAFKLAVEHDLTREEARQVTQIRSRSGEGIGECVRQALNSRPRIERSELIIGTLLSEASRRLVKEVGEERSIKSLKLALARMYPSVVVQSLRLGGNRFSLLLRAEHGQELRKLVGNRSIEEAVTEMVGNLR